MPDLKFTNPQGQTLTVNSPDGSVPSEGELDSMFSKAYSSNEQTALDKATQNFVESATPKPASPLNPIQAGAVGLVKDQNNVPQALQSANVDPKRIGLDENGNVTVDGININKTGLTNINDVAGATARGLTSNLPLLSQIGGDVALGLMAPETVPVSLMRLAVFNSATSATGEAVRQLASKGISGEALSAPSMAGEAALGASTPYVGKVLEKAFNGTKAALLGTIDKVASQQGVDGLVAMGNQLISNLDPKKSLAAIEKVRSGDMRILDNAYADETIFNNELQSRLFGTDGNIAKNIQQTYSKSEVGPQAATNLYSGLLKALPEEDVATILQQGASIKRMDRPNSLTGLGEDLANATNTLREVAGRNVMAARKVLLKQAGNVDTDVTALNNEILIPQLTKIGMLESVATPDGRVGYKINPKFDVTSTGGAQKGIFSDLVERFFNKETVSESDLIQRAGRGDTTAIAQLANMRQSGSSLSRRTQDLYFPDNNMKFKDFYKKLQNIDVQISGNEFDRVGELSPALTTYLRGLRAKTNEVAQVVGNKAVPAFNAKYSELADTLSPLTKAARDKDGIAMENYMKSIASGGSEKQLINANEINSVMKQSGVNFFDDLNAWRASQAVAKLESPIVRSQIVKSLANTLENAYNDNPNVGIYNTIKTSVDNALSKNKQFSDLAETYVLAKDLNKDTTSVFKAGFLSHGFQLPAIAGTVMGAATGGIAGSVLGGAIGTGAGLALQKPAIRKSLIEAAAKRSTGGNNVKPVLNPQQARLIANLLTRGVVGSSKPEK